MIRQRLSQAGVAAAVLCAAVAQAQSPAPAAQQPPRPPTGQDARWLAYGESESGTFYFDPASIQVRGERKRVWRLFELKDPRANGVQSGKALVEFDCKDSTYRYLRTLYYGGPQGRGKYLGGAQAQVVEPVSPGSMIGLLAQKVCGG